MPKVAILIDGMYLQHAKDQFGIAEHLDLEKKLVKVLLREGETHFRTYLFDALPYVPKFGARPDQISKRNGKQAYFDALRYLEGISIEEGVVRPKQTTCFNCKTQFNVPVQKLVDVRISVRLTQLAWSKIVDKIILLSGDRDLLPAVEAVEQSGTIVRLAYFSEGHVQTSPDLIRKCPEKHLLKGSDLAFCKLEESTPHT